MAKKISVDSTSKFPPRTSGLPKSAMLSIKPSRKAFASPGRINGSDTVRKVCQRFARSVCAASSIDGETPSTTPINTRNAIGVKANITVGEWGASNDAIVAGEADLFLQAWVTTPQGDPGAVLETLLKSDGGSNSGSFANTRLDELLDQGRLTFEHEKRKAIYDEVQEIIASEAALIPVFHVSQTNVGVAGLTGYQVHPTETYWITHETKLSE